MSKESLHRRNPYIPRCGWRHVAFVAGVFGLGASTSSPDTPILIAISVMALGVWYAIETQEALMWRRLFRRLETEAKERQAQ